MFVTLVLFCYRKKVLEECVLPNKSHSRKRGGLRESQIYTPGVIKAEATQWIEGRCPKRRHRKHSGLTPGPIEERCSILRRPKEEQGVVATLAPWRDACVVGKANVYTFQHVGSSFWCARAGTRSAFQCLKRVQQDSPTHTRCLCATGMRWWLHHNRQTEPRRCAVKPGTRD